MKIDLRRMWLKRRRNRASRYGKGRDGTVEHGQRLGFWEWRGICTSTYLYDVQLGDEPIPKFVRQCQDDCQAMSDKARPWRRSTAWSLSSTVYKTKLMTGAIELTCT